ncbi:MAG: SigE-dependent sporulation protein [Bacillales bacterium]|jgi:hypothetical protein|nr:SigE-dependent sporulation protein [Bacillales bacterium]MDF2946305.1 SigE-dependent sporulation protein [Bacillales bacterium]
MLPWWIYFVVAGIVFSGYKAITAFIEEDKEIVDERLIEHEGNYYMERIAEERKRRYETNEMVKNN